MPKNKRKDRVHHQLKSVSKINNGSEDEDMASNISVISNQSECYITEDGSDEAIASITVQENLEDSIKTCIEGISQKSANVRVASLKSLKSGLGKSFNEEFISERRATLNDSLERCLKKGKSEEQVLAVDCLCLLLVQLGSLPEKDEIYKSVIPVFNTIMLDASASSQTRSKCAEAYGLCTFIAAEDNADLFKAMTVLEAIFHIHNSKVAILVNVDKSNISDILQSSTNLNQQQNSLHNSALAAWTLLLSILSDNIILKHADSFFLKLINMLNSSNMELRITAGEATALLYELMRGIDENFECENHDELCILLKSLSTESNKFRAKRDKKVQKSSFRDILKTVESAKFSGHLIKINSLEGIFVENWSQTIQYNALCNVLETFMNVQLQENSLLRDIFDLGEPKFRMLVSGADRNNKGDKLANRIAFKERTKHRSKQRDKKSFLTRDD